MIFLQKVACVLFTLTTVPISGHPLVSAADTPDNGGLPWSQATSSQERHLVSSYARMYIVRGKILTTQKTTPWYIRQDKEIRRAPKNRTTLQSSNSKKSDWTHPTEFRLGWVFFLSLMLSSVSQKAKAQNKIDLRKQNKN